MKCPTCGADSARIEHAVGGEGGYAGWQPRQGVTLASGTPIVAPGMSYERRRPAGQARPSDVTTTALWSVGSTAVVWLVGAAWALVARSNTPFFVALVAGVGVGALLWFFLLVQSQKLLWLVERVVGRDLDGDDHEGQPPVPEPAPNPKPDPVVVEIHERGEAANSHSISWLDSGVSHGKLLDFARGVAGGRSLAESQWTGGGKPFSVDEFRELRDQLISRGLARWRNPEARAQGWELTRRGVLVIEGLSETPLPSG